MLLSNAPQINVQDVPTICFRVDARGWLCQASLNRHDHDLAYVEDVVTLVLDSSQLCPSHLCLIAIGIGFSAGSARTGYGATGAPTPGDLPQP